MSKTNEAALENIIEQYLLEQHNYISLPSELYNAEQGLFTDEVITFIKETQPRVWDALEKQLGSRTAEVIINDLIKAINVSKIGVLDILRHGFKCYGRKIQMAYFKPAHKMTPELDELYQKNRLGLCRQLYFSKNNRKSLDLCISLNGLPIITAELKNHFTGQNIFDAMKQYREDRDPKELIFTYKKRSLVHFAVDPDEVMMTTKVNKGSTFFLPFNKGYNRGKGNPPGPADNHRTHYLWEEVWQKDSLLDIVGRFMHLEIEEKKHVIMNRGKAEVKKVKKETMIFPRFHQLDVVRKLVSSARTKGAGHNYLVQHSAGSGKSNSIAWLAHRLSSLHDENDSKIFHSVIVITDRIVLDRQLQDTIYQFEHKQGVVQKIDENSSQLAESIENGTPIIISTIQKFPFAANKIDDLPDKKYAIIVDEAHSSQTGEAAAEVRGMLSKSQISDVAEERGEEEDLDDLDKTVLERAARRGKQANLSYFAFTATPKHKTLKIFDEPGENGASPFHLYSMRQAIQEKFIMDVLAQYTTYQTYYGIIKSSEDDPSVPKKKAARALARFMSLHPHNIAQKTEIMIEHFRAHTRHKIDGKAKAMVVTSSRLHAVKYKLAFDKYITEKGYDDIKTLVAFSGTVEDDEVAEKTYTEVGMNNGMKQSELPERFSTPEFQVLIVADKYQTGFDQPLLHTMYVDKKLAGIQAVQTLSRLNRISAAKEDTFVLDFYNKEEDIYESFKPYYEMTEAGDHADYQRLAELKGDIDGFHILHIEEVNAFCEVFFAGKEKHSTKDHARLESILQPPADRFKELHEDEQEEYKGKLKSFQSLYGFLSQIVPFQDAEYEKYYTVIRYFITKLPRRPDDPIGIDLDDDVRLQYYRLQKISEGRIHLEPGDADPLKGPTDVGGGTADDERIELSKLVDLLNERFGTEFTEAEQVIMEEAEAMAQDSDRIKDAAMANTLDDFKHVFDPEVEGIFIDSMGKSENFFNKLMNDEQFKALVFNHLREKVYNKIREEQGAA